MLNLLNDFAVSLSHGLPYLVALWDSGFYQVMPQILATQPDPFYKPSKED